MTSSNRRAEHYGETARRNYRATRLCEFSNLNAYRDGFFWYGHLLAGGGCRRRVVGGDNRDGDASRALRALSRLDCDGHRDGRRDVPCGDQPHADHALPELPPSAGLDAGRRRPLGVQGGEAALSRDAAESRKVLAPVRCVQPIFPYVLARRRRVDEKPAADVDADVRVLLAFLVEEHQVAAAQVGAADRLRHAALLAGVVRQAEAGALVAVA